MKNEFTKEQQKKYLKDQNCPFCGSGQIRGEDEEYEWDAVLREIVCEECDESWWEIYKLNKIEKMEE